MKSETFMTIVLVILILIGAYVGFMSEMDDNTKKNYYFNNSYFSINDYI